MSWMAPRSAGANELLFLIPLMMAWVKDILLLIVRLDGEKTLSTFSDGVSQPGGGSLPAAAHAVTGEKVISNKQHQVLGP